MMQAGQHEATGNPIAGSATGKCATGVPPREGEASAEPVCGTALCRAFPRASAPAGQGEVEDNGMSPGRG
jgi:hypothetical protein